MLQAVLFDMDGVIVDTEPEYIRLELRLAKENGILLTRKEQSRYRGVSAADVWLDAVARSGVSKNPAYIAEAEHARMDEYYRTGPLRPIHSTVRLLKRCAQAGLKIAIATSSSADNAENVVRRLNLGPYVKAIAVADLVERGKPAPDIFLLAAKLLDVSPEACVVIEDSDNGVQAAKAAGMKAIGLNRPGGGQSLSKADLVVRSLRGIKPGILGAMVDAMELREL